MLWEILSPRDCRFSVSHSCLNHFISDLHLILLPLTFHPASLHASIKVSLGNSDTVSMLSCLTAATNLDWTVYINSDMSSPAPAPPGNTCWLLSVILLLPKIFLTTLLKRMLDYEQSLFASCHAPRAWSFSSLARYARRIKKKERLLIV